LKNKDGQIKNLNKQIQNIPQKKDEEISIFDIIYWDLYYIFYPVGYLGYMVLYLFIIIFKIIFCI
jgi:hypothetical protein